MKVGLVVEYALWFNTFSNPKQTRQERDMSKVLCKSLMVSMVLFVGMLVVGCAKYYVPVTTPRPTASPSADQARVYFVKPGGSWGKANVFILQEDKAIGYLENRQVFYVDVPAGQHLFMSVSSNTEGIDANLEGGKTYYIRLFSTPSAMSTMVGGSEDLHMAPIEPGTEQWENRIVWIDGAALVKMNKAKVGEWEAKYAERNAERLENFRSGEAELKKIEPQFGE
jgi:hypothetical protein